MKNGTEYNNSIAFLRVLATISVVIGHMAADTDFKIALFKIIYSFHVPLFVFISGYLMAKGITNYNCFFDMVNAKVKRLLVPYYIGLWTAILPCHLLFFNDVEFKLDSINLFMESIENEHLWFLWILFWIFIVTFHLLKYILKTHFGLGLVFLGILGYIFLLPLTANINLIRYSYYFVLGFIIGNRGKLLEYLRTRKSIFTLIIIVTTIVTIMGQIYIQKTYETYVGAWFIVSHLKSYLCVSTITILDLYLLAEYFKKGITYIMSIKIINYIDRDSLYIYIYHLVAGKAASEFVITPIFKHLPQNYFGEIKNIVGVLNCIFIPITIIELYKKIKPELKKLNDTE